MARVKQAALNKKAKLKKKDLFKKQIIVENNAPENSVFAVTEKLLQLKKETQEKGLPAVQEKKKGKKLKEKKEIIEQNNAHLVERENFFRNEVNSTGETKSKPQWFESNIRDAIATYCLSMHNYEMEKNPQNEAIKTQNEKKLFRFFKKLASQLNENIDNIKLWYTDTKNDIEKAQSFSNISPSYIKISLLNRKLKSISKQMISLQSEKVESKSSPEWFDQQIADLIKIRNQARRKWKAYKTKENKIAFRMASKTVKIEVSRRKQSGFVSAEPYVPEKVQSNLSKKKKPQLKKKENKSCDQFIKGNNKNHIKFDN